MEDFLADILDAEFQTVADDGSLTEVRNLQLFMTFDPTHSRDMLCIKL